MTKVIGLTGGIGSGKTTVAQAFEKLGVAVYIADDEARKIMDTPEIVFLLKNEFGPQVFDGNTLDRKKLAQVVFENPERLERLNAMIHPLVKQHFSRWLSHYPASKFVIREAAILFESGSYKDCDKIITVTAPLEARISRVMARDNTDHASVLKRINNQWTDQQRIALSDYIIVNTDPENTNNQINIVYEKLTNQ